VVAIVVREVDSAAEEVVVIEEVGEASREVLDEVSFTSPRSDSQSKILNRLASYLQLRKYYENKSS
jgi:hypothetical protein